MERRTFFAAGPVAVFTGWRGLTALLSSAAATLTGCFGGVSYEVTVHPDDDGASVFAATARYYRLGLGPEHPTIHERMVVEVNGVPSGRWVFEIDGARFDGSADAARLTRVRAGQVIAWLEA